MVTVTEANLNYMGSITIDEDLMDAAGLIAGEKVQVVDNNNGERFETYVIRGERGSGCICLNGAAARKVLVGDTVIIMSYALMDFEEARSFRPSIVFPKNNRVWKQVVLPEVSCEAPKPTLHVIWRLSPCSIARHSTHFCKTLVTRHLWA